jgi:hypothetical protein
MIAIIECTLKLKASPPHICLQYAGLLPQRYAVCKIHRASFVKENDGIPPIIFCGQSDRPGRCKTPLEKATQSFQYWFRVACLLKLLAR